MALKNVRPRITRAQKIAWRREYLARRSANSLAEPLSSKSTDNDENKHHYLVTLMSKKITSLKMTRDSASSLPENMKLSVQNKQKIYCNILSEDDKHYHILTNYTGQVSEFFAWKADWLKIVEAEG